jgi:RsmE family RNA methyltransferase
MNMILLFKEDFYDKNKVRLIDRRAEHIASILRSSKDDSLKVGLLNGYMGEGVVLTADKDLVELEVSLTEKPPLPLPLNLLIALPRPQTLKKVLEYSIAMGVKNIHFMHTKKVEKSYWMSPLLAKENLRKHIFLGLEQGCDTVMPEITFHDKFKPFIEDIVPGVSENTLKLIAHPGENSECPRLVSRQVTLALGPEGGFNDFELEKFREQGFRAVDLGPRILRIENALAVLLGRIF